MLQGLLLFFVDGVDTLRYNAQFLHSIDIVPCPHASADKWKDPNCISSGTGSLCQSGDALCTPPISPLDQECVLGRGVETVSRTLPLKCWSSLMAKENTSSKSSSASLAASSSWSSGFRPWRNTGRSVTLFHPLSAAKILNLIA